MKRFYLKAAFLLAFFATFIQSALVPSLNFMTFAPFLILAIVHLNFPKAIWLGFGCGLIIDLLSSTQMGLYALCYTITCASLYRQKRNFIDEKPLNIALFTALFSFCSTLLLVLLLFLFDKSAVYSGQWAFFDLWTMPLLDAVYALVWFYCPLLLAQVLKKQWRIWKIRYKRLKNG